MKALPLATVLLLAASGAAAEGDWATDETCVGEAGPGVLRLRPAPTPLQPEKVRSAHWIEIALGWKLWARDDDGDDPIEFTLEHEGKEVQRWGGHMFLGVMDQFRALVGDLDLDARPELVVVYVQSVSDGLAAEHSVVSIFDGRDWSAAPLQFHTEQFSPDDSFRRENEHEPCGIIHAQWRDGVEIGLRDGTYLVGARFRYHAGRLVPDISREVVARRLLFSFAEALATGGPGTWFADRRVRPWPTGRLPPRPSATLEAWTEEIASWTFDDGSRDAWSVSWPWTFGDAVTGRPLPMGYRPGATAPGLVGSRVSFSRSSESRWIAWLWPSEHAGTSGAAPAAPR